MPGSRLRSASERGVLRRGGGQPDLFADLSGFALKVAEKVAREITILRVEVFLGVFIGAVTFTGSVIAYGKLAGQGRHQGHASCRAGTC